MSAKNLTVILVISAISIALAFGITFIVSLGNSQVITINTPEISGTDHPRPSAITEIFIDPNSTAVPTPGKNCTFPIDTWIQYPDAWKIDSYRIGDKTYSNKEMLDILRGNSSDPRGMLLTQIIIVVLNQQNGADATGIRGAFSEATFWLETFPPGSTPSDGDLQKADSIANTLERYNNGLLGVPTCLYDVSASTPVKMPVLQQIGRSATPSQTLTVPPVIFMTRIPFTPTTYREQDPVKKRTAVPRTPVPPTAVPPTSVPPTKIVPTVVPTEAPNPTPVPPTSVPPTVAVTNPPPPTSPPAPTISNTTAPNPQPTSIPPTPKKRKIQNWKSRYCAVHGMIFLYFRPPF